jgi:hypothetical protein
LAVDHLSILGDRHVYAGAAFRIEELDRLWHGGGVFAAVIKRLESKAGGVQVRILLQPETPVAMARSAQILRTFLGGHLCKPLGRRCAFDGRFTHYHSTAENSNSGVAGTFLAFSCLAIV